MSNLRICLDPGHARLANKGAVSGYYEGTAMYNLALYLKSELEKYEGIEVFVTKPKLDCNPSLEERGKFAVDNQCEVFLSLHSNGHSSSSARGVSLYYSQHRAESRDLGDRLSKAVVNQMNAAGVGTYYRGSSIKKYPAPYTSWDYYGVIRNSVGPDGENSVVKYSYILEQGFHSNPTECQFLNNDDNLKKLAAAEAEVIANYFDKSYKESEAPEIVVEEKVSYVEYKVKKGDNLSRIAAVYSTTVAKIYEANRNLIKNINVISVGWVLKIPQTVVTVIDESVSFKEGDEVKFKSGAKTWASGTTFPAWVGSSKLYIRSQPRDNGTTIVVSTLKTGAVTGTARIDDLEPYAETKNETVAPKPATPVEPPKAPTTAGTSAPQFAEGDRVKFKSSATKWANGLGIPSWVKKSVLYIRSKPRNNGTQIAVSVLKTGAITGTAKVSDLEKK